FKRRSIAGNTAQYPSQYRQALQITMRRSPSVRASLTGGMRSFLSGDASKDGSDRHAEPSQITFADHIARHDLARRQDIRFGTDPLYSSRFTHPETEIRERDARP